MKKLTAFQWYIHQHKILAKTGPHEDPFKLFDEIRDKTLEMEKEQIINAANDGYDEAINEYEEFTSGDDYYNKIYGDKKVEEI